MSRQDIRKGMVLAAGLGTRLLPITKELPKPLVPVLNVPNILYSLHLLAEAGIQEVILNVHHLPVPLEEFLGDGSRFGMRLHYSREPVLLGTGGGVKKAEPFFEKERFVLANCDFITNLELAPVIASHLKRRALATMVLLEAPELQASYSKVGTDADGHLCSLPKHQTGVPARTGMFTGVHVLEPETLECLEAIPCGINDILYPALMREKPARVDGYFAEGCYWHDTGDLKVFWNTSIRLLESLAKGDRMLAQFLKERGGYEQKRPGVWMPSDENLPDGVTLNGPSILGAGCRLEKGAEVGPLCILGDRTVVGEKSKLSEVVALGAAEIAPSTISHGTLYFHRSVLF